ncbi:SusC/RagA family TonB-linked outer membrane protein [Parapedobacter defluvii]|uniref:SusC/RagA family TonB-linked outer membrane protein n=1 Tax=Parapedobacter defluvii TaxID=2045106 RepID=A0ABQ1M7K6_9SPHI|nr:TonB-dependent receptor [Parapedobacter defluvii]GGC34688.1 SusC/RagA family TonB-linked outer membrane protein [Parapedobacter defluvii]
MNIQIRHGIKIMRISTIIYMWLLSTVQLLLAYPSDGQVLGKRLDISFGRTTLRNALSQLERKETVFFAYESKLLADANPQVGPVQFTNASLKEVLDNLLINTGLTYKEEVIGTVTLLRKQRNGRVAGKVTDSRGEPLSGATVRIGELGLSTSTDREGNYSLAVQPGSYTVSASFIAYVKQEKSAVVVKEDGRTTVDFVLADEQGALQEVVVVGYGTQQRGDLTGSVASVRGAEISEIPTTNPIQALKGKAAGVDIFNSGNEPGGGIDIRIRGEKSISGSNSPLIVLDGIPMAGGLNEINPQDISSIEVLKDASATAIYGSRASNGVVLITSKRGELGKTRISYDGYYGISQLSNKLDLMDGEQFAQLRREANRTASADGSYPADKTLFDDIALQSLANGVSTDWQDFAYQNGNKQNHQLAFNGGGERTQFAVSLNYYGEDGLLEGVFYRRGGLRVNLDHRVNDRLKFGVSSFASRSKQTVQTNDIYDNIVRLNPLGVPYDEEGNARFRPTNDEGQRVNPLSDLENQLDERFRTRLFASVFGEYQLAKGFKYRLNVGPELEYGKRGYFYGSQTTVTQGGLNQAGVSDSDIFSFTVENILDFDRRFGENHRVQATALQSYQEQQAKTASTNVANLPYDSQLYHALNTAGEIRSVGSNYQKWQLLSYMARVNYDFRGKYFATVTARTDGSSRFAPGNKWSFFPSAALGWRISDEQFLADSKWLSDLKLRLSYGVTGNTGIEPYQTFSLLDKTAYAFGSSGGAGFLPSTISNPDLKWETTSQLNLALDFGLWKNRLSGTVEAYQADTKDLLLYRSLPGSTGFEEVLQNIGALSNKGIELTVNGTVIEKNDFSWEVGLNFSRNRNEIVDLFGTGADDVGNGWFIGHPIHSFYDYRKIGIWQLDEAEKAASYGFRPGMIKVEDVDGNGKLDADDRVILGSQTPDWVGGLTTRLVYREWELSAVLHARQGYLTSSSWYNNSNRLAGRYNNLNVDYWTPENPTNANPRPDVNQESVYLGSTLAYKDASFVRVRNLALAYRFPVSWTDRWGIQGLRIHVTAENPFTFTPYEGYDPEFETSGERAMYPSAKLYSFGINATF